MTPRYGNQGERKPLGDEELVDILDNAYNIEWAPYMEMKGKTPFLFDDYEELKEFYKDIEGIVEVTKIVNNKEMDDEQARETNKKRKRDNESDSESEEDSSMEPKKVRECPHCHKYHKDHDGCWSLEKNKDKRPNGWKPPNKSKSNNDKYSSKEVAAMIKMNTKKERKKARRALKKALKEAKNKRRDDVGVSLCYSLSYFFFF